MENNNLRTLVTQLDSKAGFSQYLSAMESQFVIKLYKVTEINPQNVIYYGLLYDRQKLTEEVTSSKNFNRCTIFFESRQNSTHFLFACSVFLYFKPLNLLNKHHSYLFRGRPRFFASMLPTMAFYSRFILI